MSNEVKEHKCSRAGINSSPIITRTEFGHGDSTHQCYVICEICGKKGEVFSNWGLFEHETFRNAQKSWNDKLEKDE